MQNKAERIMLDLFYRNRHITTWYDHMTLTRHPLYPTHAMAPDYAYSMNSMSHLSICVWEFDYLKAFKI